MLVKDEKRVELSETDNRRCVGPDRVEENHGIVDDDNDECSDATSEMRGESIEGVVATVELAQELTEKKDGGKGCRVMPTPSPAIK